MRQYVIPEIFFQKIAEKGKMYSRMWFYWLGTSIDEIFKPDFLEKQATDLKGKGFPNISEIGEIYHFGVHLIQQDFKIIGKRKQKPVISEKRLQTITDVLEYLNKRAGTSYTTKNIHNVNMIAARLDEGYSFGDIKYVIDKKVKDWKGTEMDGYLRPLTLFNSTKFENYLNSRKKYPESAMLVGMDLPKPLKPVENKPSKQQQADDMKDTLLEFYNQSKQGDITDPLNICFYFLNRHGFITEADVEGGVAFAIEKIKPFEGKFQEIGIDREKEILRLSRKYYVQQFFSKIKDINTLLDMVKPEMF